MLKFTNNASATLGASISAAATSVTLTTGNGALFPALAANEFCYATLVDSSNNLEVIKITGRTGDVLTVARGQDNTTARAYNAGDKCELRLVAAVFQELVQRDGSVAMTANLNHGGFKSTNMAQGTATGEAVTADRQVLTGAGSGLQGGGNLTADLNLSLTATGVVAGSKGSASQIPVITVDAQGRVTSLTGVALDLSTKADVGGGNATGTWPISISGNAATVPWTGVSSRPTALSQFTNNLGNYGAFIDGLGFSSSIGSGNSTKSLWRSGNTIYWNYNCHCDCCCCFAPGTLVLMADGTSKPIEHVAVGEKVAGFAGEVTVAHKFDTTLKTNSMFLLNGELEVTGGHLFKTDSGWKAIDMAVYPHGVFFRSEQFFDGGELVDVKHQSDVAESVTQLKVGDVVNGIEVKSIEQKHADVEFNVHNMIVEGGDGFVLASGYKVDGFMRQTCGVCK